MRRAELPSQGAHHAVVADFNHDGFLDIFISNYQSEYTRSIDSHNLLGQPARATILWRTARRCTTSQLPACRGRPERRRLGRLAVSNHVQNGDHHANSLIFWNRNGRFSERDTTSLPTIGPHMMTGVDPGNIYTRVMEESYTQRRA